MKSEQEIKERIKYLKHLLKTFPQGEINKIERTREIKTLQWVLDEIED